MVQSFSLPSSWKRPEVLLSSLLINVLALAFPVVVLQVYDRIIPHQAIDTLMVLIIGMLVVIGCDFLLKTWRSVILSWDSAKFDHQASMAAIDQLLKIRLQDFENKPAGYFIDKFYALEKVQEFFSGQAILLLMDLPFVLIYLWLIAYIDGLLVFIPLTLLLVFLWVSLVTGKKLQQVLEARSTLENRRQNFIIEILQGIHTIKSMAMEAFMLRRYEKLQLQSAENIYELSHLQSLVQGVGASFSQMTSICFVGFGSVLVLDGQLTIGALVAGTMLTSRVLQPGLKAMNTWIQFQGAKLAINKVNAFFELSRESYGQVVTDKKLSGHYEIRNLCFKYPGQPHNLIEKLNLEILPGESIGITGENGAGKSTLLNLMAGFIRPGSGDIYLDGVPLQDYQSEFLHGQIGFVPQNGVLVEGSILENMTLYREDEATAEAMELAKLLGLDKFIAQLPNGLDTFIGGAAMNNLPEGVRQNIIIVRSLISDPQIILFDDANANFDIRSDNKLVALMKYMQQQNKTLIVVSHRPSFLKICQRQFVLTQGQMVERT
jgi:ATP-binding cassette subfamily C protein LapB